jgi:hypothetical protein
MHRPPTTAPAGVEATVRRLDLRRPVPATV